MATNYISTHGTIWGEISGSGVMTSYGHDALGSVVETFSNGALQNTYRYKPSGASLAKNGTAPDPKHLWNGAGGYRATGLSNCEYYVRARTYSSQTARWTTIDPIWPAESPYGYCRSAPSSHSDPSGLSRTIISSTAGPVKSYSNGGIDEAYARIRSADYVMGVQGVITLPWLCDVMHNDTATNVIFYVSLDQPGASPVATQVDCGVSFVCPRGWKGLASTGQAPGTTKTMDCPWCGSLSSVGVSLYYSTTGQWSCSIGAASTFPLFSNPPMLLPGLSTNSTPAPGQVTVGAGWPSDSQHPVMSPSMWSNMSLLKGPPTLFNAVGTWVTWDGSDNTFHADTDLVGGFQMYSDFFPFVAWLPILDNTICGNCPTRPNGQNAHIAAQ